MVNRLFKNYVTCKVEFFYLSPPPAYVKLCHFFSNTPKSHVGTIGEL